MPGMLTVGVPTEVKADERRVAMTPDGVREMESHGVEVLVQAGAGAGRRASPTTPTARRAPRSSPTADEVWARAGMVAKVKEPQSEEFALLRDDLVLFTYLHLAAYPKVADALCDAGTTGIAYETVMRPDGSLPLLAPMSEVAGRMAVQAGARFLEAPQGGRGVLLGGAPGVQPGAGRGHRRRQRRVELGVDRRGHGGRGQPARQEPRPAALRRPDPQGPHHHPGLEPGHGRALRRRGRPRHRRRARRRRPGPGGRSPRTWSGR